MNKDSLKYCARCGCLVKRGDSHSIKIEEFDMRYDGSIGAVYRTKKLCKECSNEFENFINTTAYEKAEILEKRRIARERKKYGY